MEAVTRRAKRGFNLIEAAIVLGVVGIVVGAIWVSAANFYENYKVNKTVEDLQFLVKNIQSLISVRDSEILGSASLSQTLIKAGIIPKDWIMSNNIDIKTHFNNDVRVANEIGVPPYENTPNRFYIEITNNIKKSFCIKLIVALSASATMQGQSGSWWTGNRVIINVRIIKQDNSSIDIQTFPISPSTAEGSCDDVKEIILYFPYTRINN